MSFMGGSASESKSSIHCSERYNSFAEAVRNQNNIISSNAPTNDPVKVVRRRTSSSEAYTTIQKPPSVIFPEAIGEIDAVISPPLANETKWTTTYSAPGEVLTIHEDVGFYNALMNWKQITFHGVKCLPQGTWIQYTSNLYPDYSKRKKTICIIGENPMSDNNELTVWSLFRKDGSSENASTTMISSTMCRKGGHLISLRPRESPNFMECEMCNCKGWKLTKGSASQARLFYASPWAISNNDKNNE